MKVQIFTRFHSFTRGPDLGLDQGAAGVKVWVMVGRSVARSVQVGSSARTGHGRVRFRVLAQSWARPKTLAGPERALV